MAELAVADAARAADVIPDWIARRAKLEGHPAATVKGFTLIEILVVMVILAVLAAALVPLITGIKARANQTVCAGNLRQWGIGYQSYMGDNNGFLPQQAEVAGNSDTSWQELIAPYVIGDEVKIWNRRNALRAKFRCPGDKTTGIVYGCSHYFSPIRYNRAPSKLLNLKHKVSDLVLMSENYTGEFWDTRADNLPAAGGRIDYSRHKVGGKNVANILFVDFHIEALSYRQTLDRPLRSIPVL